MLSLCLFSLRLCLSLCLSLRLFLCAAPWIGHAQKVAVVVCFSVLRRQFCTDIMLLLRLLFFLSRSDDRGGCRSALCRHCLRIRNRKTRNCSCRLRLLCRSMDSLLLQKQKLCPSGSPISAASRKKKETRDLELLITPPSSSSSSQAMELLLTLHLRRRILEKHHLQFSFLVSRDTDELHKSPVRPNKSCNFRDPLLRNFRNSCICDEHNTLY